MEFVGKVREMRRDNPSWSAKKIHAVLMRGAAEGRIPSAASIERIIKRYGMYYRADIKAHRRRSRTAAKSGMRKRKPHGLRAARPNEIIEFDMKHINLPGKRLYALCGIDQYTRRVAVHVSMSRSGKTALMKIRERFGAEITIVNENGSEAEEWLASDGIGIRQY